MSKRKIRESLLTQSKLLLLKINVQVDFWIFDDFSFRINIAIPAHIKYKKNRINN